MPQAPFCRAIACGLLLVAPATLRSQPLTINTLAGSAGQGSADGTGSNARFYQPQGLGADSAGNVYVADTWNHTIRKITSAGVVTTLAGSPGNPGSSDGTGANAQFYQPQGVAADSSNNVYVADTGNYTIRKITSGGVVTTLAGFAGNAGSSDGAGTNAQFYYPEGIAVDTSGNLYAADTWNHTIRKITPAGTVSTLAGSAGNYGSANGTGTNAQFYQPEGIAVDSSGNVYVGDTANSAIRIVTAGGVVSTLAGSAGTYGSTNGTGTNAQFYEPQGVAVDTSDNVYVADYFNHTIRKVTSSGVVSTLAGSAGNYGAADATGASARVYGPQGVAVSGTNIYVADTGNGTIRQITPAGVVNTLAGSASTGSADGTGGNARFYWPAGIALDTATNLYVADTENGTIRKATPAGVVSTLAGSAGNFGSTNATGSSARFYGPQSVAVDVSGNIYVADTANQIIRMITSVGVVSTLAGAPGTNGVTDGTNASARFNCPTGVAVDGARNVYVADTWNHTIRKVTSAGVVSTLAGSPGIYGCSDGTGSNIGTNTAQFHCPAGVALDSATNIYVADCYNHTIRRITPAGVVSTLAGLPGVWGNADGTNSDALFFEPRGVAADSATNIYVMDSGNHTVRKVSLVGTNWVVSTVAGCPVVRGSSDGVGSNARFYWPAGVAVQGAGSFYMADLGNNTLRSGLLTTNGAVVITNQPQSQTVNQGGNVTFSVGASGTTPFYYQWYFNTAGIAGATASSYTQTNVQPADAGTYSVVVNNQINSVTSSNAVLTVNPLPVITNQPVSLVSTQGDTAIFNVTAGPASVTCQWQKNGVNLADDGNISGSATATLTISNIASGDAASYTVVLGNTVGSVTSAIATLTVLLPVAILTQPQSQTVPVSADVTLSVTATGTAPLGYQWQFNGTALGGTLSSYIIGNAHTDKSGAYTVLVSNLVGVLTSAVATVTVLDPPAIVTQPQSQTITQGAAAAFTVSATGSDPLSCQWQKNGTNLSNGGNVSGAATATLAISNAAAGDAASYAVLVTNAVGSALSTAVMLTVVASAPPQFDSVGLLADGSVQLAMSGTPAASYLLECTSNWVDWASLASLTNTTGLFQYHDLSATNVSQRFYRLQLGP